MSNGDPMAAKPIVNIADLEYKQRRHGTTFDVEVASVATRIGARDLGYNVMVIPPGKSPSPFHRHHANEEMCFVLSGRGSLRIGDRIVPLCEGDFVCLTAGGEAHQIRNDSDEPLRILNVSTMRAPDVVEYPDSGKTGVFVGAAPGRPIREQTVRRFWQDALATNYWTGEE